MPVRTYKRKARVPPRPRKYRRMARTMRPSRAIMQSHVNVERTWYSANWTPNTTGTNGFWRYITVNLGACPNVTEYTNLFEQYKINKVTFVLRPRYDSFSGENTTDTTLPGVTNQGATRVHTVIDPRSNLTPSGTYTSTTLNTFLENGKVKTFSGNKAITIPIKYPAYVNDVNNVAGAENPLCRGRWFSTAATTIEFRGCHIFLQDVNLTGVFGQSFDIFTTMSMSFKGPR